MSTMTWAAALTAVVAGPPLYGLVASGDLDLETALLRGGLVFAGAAVGVHLIMQLVDGYERERRRQEKIAKALAELEDVTLEGIPLPHDPTTS